MNPEELAQQIAKFKSRRHKTRLAYFCTLISLFLTFSSFASGITLYSLASFLLILPLPLYFTLQSYKLTRKSRSVQERLSTQESTCLAPDSQFSFTQIHLSALLCLPPFSPALFPSFLYHARPHPYPRSHPHTEQSTFNP